MNWQGNLDHASCPQINRHQMKDCFSVGEKSLIHTVVATLLLSFFLNSDEIPLLLPKELTFFSRSWSSIWKTEEKICF